MAVITISRQFGSGGKTLGTLVAKKLGYVLIDEEILGMIAEEADVSVDWVDEIEREAGSEGFLTRLVHKFGPFRKGYVGIAMESKPGYLDNDLYLALLHKIIPAIAASDNVVIIGRGGQYILSDNKNAYHFFLIANMAHRISFMMENYSLSDKEAQKVIKNQDTRRLNIYRYFGKTDYDYPHLYNLVFNMNRISMEKAVHTVCQLVRGAYSSS